jgi:DNA-binding IclR family transcriptional regulator
LRALTRFTITDPYALRNELQVVRERGWSADVEELITGWASISAPIQDRRGVVVGAIGISGSLERLCESRRPREELVSQVREAARSVSRELGAIPW